ncbi:MAG: dynamin family protein [Campylobacteraceae bacterium]|nr:dynamin family protein [Campylobacteraceae bacterium]
MNLANDYFLLYHGIKIEKQYSFNTRQRRNKEEFFDIAALILSANRKNYDKYLPLKSFADLTLKISDRVPKNLDELNQLQHGIVESVALKTKKDDISKIHSSFKYLKTQEIINDIDYEKLISLFDPREIIIIEDEIDIKSDIDLKGTMTFQENKKILEDLIFELKDIITQDDYIDQLNSTQEYMNSQKFSIGITGVMNAGKSTMLNALMGQEILGSAVVPETANLTIVKYDKKPSANVFYWNQKEWNNIEQSASELKSIKEFIDETKEHFGDELSDYIQEESRVEEVDINNLAAFTSAEASGKRCNLVKYVELKTDLNFLRDGIEIVDTPGLDDPVIQREEITKEYVGQCDLMIHLMNVSQSATLKDVEFIIDALLYQNITKILIVITRADTVTKEELAEVIKYTKTSIKRQLKTINKDSQLDYILDTIKFVPISGKMALYHRTGKSEEAIKAGFRLEDTGILDIEEYLNDTLFGVDSQKSELIVKSVKTQLIRIIHNSRKALDYELVLLSKSKEELNLELEEFNKKKIANEKIFFSMKEDINIYKNDAKNYISSLETFLTAELIDLQNVIKHRVVSDVRYSFEKTKKRPENSRVKVIVETAIKDGIIDVIRDYRYKFIKKSQGIGETCEQKYQEFGFSIGHKNENFDAMGFFQDDFKSGFLTSSNDVLISKIVSATSKSKSNKLNELDRIIEDDLKQEFTKIESNIKEKAKKISGLLIDNFFETLNAPLKHFEQKLLNNEKILKDQIDSFETKDQNRGELSIEIHKKLKKLEITEKACK